MIAVLYAGAGAGDPSRQDEVREYLTGEER